MKPWAITLLILGLISISLVVINIYVNTTQQNVSIEVKDECVENN